MAAMAAVSPVGRSPGILGEARSDSFAQMMWECEYLCSRPYQM
jgi:hypothetical protein